MKWEPPLELEDADRDLEISQVRNTYVYFGIIVRLRLSQVVSFLVRCFMDII